MNAPAVKGSGDRRHLQLPGNVDAVASASAWVRVVCQEWLVEADLIHRVDLCVSELLANIVSHGFDPADSHRRVELSLEFAGETLHVTIGDDGVPFNLLEHPPHVPPTSLATARIGGLGVHLVKSFADRIGYERQGDRNVTTLSFRVQGQPSATQSRRPRGPERRRGRSRTAPGNGVERRTGEDRRRYAFIADFPIFEGVDPAALEQVMSRCAISDLADGEVLLRPGEQNQYVAFVISGRLRVHFESPESPDFIEVLAGDCVGEMSVIDGSPVSAFVVSDRNCRALLIPGEVFVQQLLIIPRVARNVIRMLASRMRRNNRIIIERFEASLKLERLEQELDAAREIQAGMLPPGDSLLAGVPGLHCAARMRSARDVGGDFYDAFFVDPDHVVIAVGDVCGKGMPAALFMVKSVTLLRGEAVQRAGGSALSASALVERVNTGLFLSMQGRAFVTLFCAIYELSTGRLAYVNAGHNPPLLTRPDSPPAPLAQPRNLVCGVKESLSYRSGEVVLEPGATLLLYTDGVTEACSPEGQMFGEERLREFFEGTSAADAPDVLAGLFEEVDRFTAGNGDHDDVTALVLARRPQPLERSGR